MKKPNKLTTLFENALTFADEHQREIFLGVQIVGTVMTGVLAWKAAPKAQEVLDNHKRQMENIPKDDKEKRKKETIDTIKDMAPIVAPPLVTGAMTIGCALGGYKASTKQIAALSAAYTLSEKALSEYTEKAKEIIGPKKTQTIKDEIYQEHIMSNPVKNNTIINTGAGNTLCYDDYSGRYFYSDPEYIRKCVNDVNEQLRDDYYMSLNEFYSMLKLKDVKLGDDLGFCMEDGYLNLSFSATLTDDNQPCLVLNYDVSPKYGYGDFGGPARFGR